MCEHIARYALSSRKDAVFIYRPDFGCMFMLVLLRVRLRVHSDEAGAAAWRLIHHFPPWPAVPSEERRAVTVTLGSFWWRKMVHPPPAPPPPPPPTSTSTSTSASPSPPLSPQPTGRLRRRGNDPSNSLRHLPPRRQRYAAHPRGHIANQSPFYRRPSSFVHRRLEKLPQVLSPVTAPLPPSPPPTSAG